MQLRNLNLHDFRSYEDVSLEPADGLTVVVGANGQGKTNLLEAVGWLATQGSFRGVPNEALVRHGATAAVVRAEIVTAERMALVEAEITAGRPRVQVNRQRLQRARDLLGVLRVSVFAPDDLVLVKGGPAERRRYLDDTLVSLHPRHEAARRDLDRILRQRNALLRQTGGRLTPDTEATLDVWDERLVVAGETLGGARAELVADLSPMVRRAAADLAGVDTDLTLDYAASWREDGLAAALTDARRDEVRRGISLVGPHRDDLVLGLNGMPARSHASQGEQRTLALALRLAAHRLVTEQVGTPPVLLLDDVFSELDDARAAALLAHLPPGQALLTTAIDPPAGARPELVLRVEGGRLRPA